jgi:ABC-2 type transport system permease protein
VYAGAFYDVMGLMLILVYAIAAGNKLVVSEVDRGDISFTLNTPVNRKEVVFTKAVFYLLSMLAMILALSIIGTAANAVISPGKLNYGKFWTINFVMFCFLFAISGISFAASCWLNKTGKALMIGAELPIAFFLLNTVAGFGSDLAFFKYLTLNTLFDPMGIIAGNSCAANALILAGIGFVLYTAGIIRFVKKDLPI